MVAQVFDRARSAYVRLPKPIRRAFGGFLSHLPANFRLGPTYATVRAEISRARADPDFAVREQRARLARLLDVALTRTAYYHEELNRVFGPGATPERLLEPSAWRRIPILTNRLVSAHRDRMCSVPASHLDVASTGGSSGQPLTFYLDKSRSPTELAFVMEAWSRAGFRDGDWRATFRGFNIANVEERLLEVDPGLREVQISAYHLSDRLMHRYAGELERRDIRFLQGYPSALVTYAAFRQRMNYPPATRIAGILLHSEPVHDGYRRIIQAAFPRAALVPFYGLSEKCAFAVEVPGRPGEYEFDPLYGVTELVDPDGEPVVDPGCRGRIVSTGLLFTGMPFLRYDTGDEAVLVELPDRRNGYRLRLAAVAPRSCQAFVVARSGHLVQVGNLIMGDDLHAMTEFQFVQEVPGEVRLLAASDHRDRVERFARDIEVRSNGELAVVTEIVPDLPRTCRGKRQLIVQRLDIHRMKQDAGILEEGT